MACMSICIFVIRMATLDVSIPIRIFISVCFKFYLFFFQKQALKFVRDLFELPTCKVIESNATR